MLGMLIYLFSVSFQLSAGILLLIGNASTKKERVVQKYCEAHRLISVSKNGSLNNYEELRDIAMTAWINKFAFAYLVIGYLISIFGESPNEKGLSFIIVSILCSLLTVLAYGIAKIKMKKYDCVNFNDFILRKDTLVIEEDIEE